MSKFTRKSILEEDKSYSANELRLLQESIESISNEKDYNQVAANSEVIGDGSLDDLFAWIDDAAK